MDTEPEVLAFHFAIYGPYTLVHTEDDCIGISTCSFDDTPDRDKGIAVAVVKALCGPLTRNDMYLAGIPREIGSGYLRAPRKVQDTTVNMVCRHIAMHAVCPEIPVHLSHTIETIADLVIETKSLEITSVGTL